jgi:Ca-activated chloride channel family protein
MSAPEAAALDDLDQELQQRKIASYRKRSQQQVYSRSSKRSSGHTRLGYAFNGGPILGDITQQAVEAIVNSTDPSLSSQGAISAAIHRAAGPELLVACQQLQGCAVGEAKVTAGFSLPAQWVIHTVCPAWQGGRQGETALLAQCYEHCLELAVRKKIRSIAFPAIGTGALGFPVDLAARIAFETIGQFLFRTTAIGQVLIVCADEKTLQVYQTEFQRVCSWQ